MSDDPWSRPTLKELHEILEGIDKANDEETRLTNRLELSVPAEIITSRGNTIAAMKSLGATGTRVFVIYLTQVLSLAAIGATIGLVLGAALPFAISALFGKIIPLPIEPALHPAQLALALLYGLMTALAFAIWPLGRAHDIPVSALFRDHVDSANPWPRRQYVIAAIVVGGTLAALAILLAHVGEEVEGGVVVADVLEAEMVIITQA